MTRESAVEKKLRLAIKAAGGLCLKLPASLYRGIPDRLVLLPGGRVYFIELKRPKGRTSITQIRYQKILQAMGFYSDIIYGLEGVEEFINDHVQSRL